MFTPGCHIRPWMGVIFIPEGHNLPYCNFYPWVPYSSLDGCHIYPCVPLVMHPHPHVPYSPLSAIVILKYHFHPHVLHPLLWVPYLPRCAIPVQLCYIRPWPLLLLVWWGLYVVHQSLPCIDLDIFNLRDLRDISQTVPNSESPVWYQVWQATECEYQIKSVSVDRKYSNSCNHCFFGKPFCCL